jgi:hypothetical protein
MEVSRGDGSVIAVEVAGEPDSFTCIPVTGTSRS